MKNTKMRVPIWWVKQKLKELILALPEPRPWMYIPAMVMSVAALIISIWKQ